MAIGYGVACPKPESRLKARIERNRTNYGRERAFKADVWTRDQGVCRACGVKVLRALELHPKRGEVHHLESRTNQAVRYDPRNGILLCAMCHEDIERYRMVIVGRASQHFKVDGVRYLDAGATLKFQRAEHA